MNTIVGWRLDDEKIILSITDGDGKDFDVELPLEMYGEIIQEGPPSEEKQIRGLIDKIYEIRKNRLLAIDTILEGDENLRAELTDIRKETKTARDELAGATSTLEVNKWKAVLGSCKVDLQTVTKEKAILQEYRHLVKLTYQEEGKLRAKLLTKLA